MGLISRVSSRTYRRPIAFVTCQFPKMSPKTTEEEFYEVEKILNHDPPKATIKSKTKYYHVKWLGYGHDENTWEEAKKMHKMTPDLIEDYWIEQKEKKKKKVVSKDKINAKSKKK